MMYSNSFFIRGIYCMFIAETNNAKIEFNNFCQCSVTLTQQTNIKETVYFNIIL